MLVLSRKRNETIVVGNARITIVEIRGDKIKLGVEAPMEVNVDRLEVWEKKQLVTVTK